MLEEFKKYVDGFYTGDEEADFGIKLKYAHSLRVMKIMKEMAISFNFDKEKIEISSVIGLLHDYGRFYQWKHYHTFYDKDSIDHADYGVEKLFDDGEIVKFYSKKENYDLINKAIYYHNKYSAPNDEFCKMIRDADKIDILWQFEKEISFKEDGEISKKVLEDFNNQKLVDAKNQKTGSDGVLKMLAYIYDLNYGFSFKYIKEHKIIEKVFKNIKNKEKFEFYFDEINYFIDKKINKLGDDLTLEFKKFVSKFDLADPNINRKYYHSLRVRLLSKLIAKHVGFNEDDASTIEVVGMLHDYGRFYQWEKYHTFRDCDSIDHGDYAVLELFDNDEITNFWYKKEDYDEIYDAIKYHNKIVIPDNLSEHNKVLCKVIRDADKLDILYLYASKRLIFPEDGEINIKVKSSFDKEETVNKKDERTSADHAITVLALIYDLNFNYSFYHLKNYKILSQIYENVKDKEKFKFYFDKINEYIDMKIKEMEEC